MAEWLQISSEKFVESLETGEIKRSRIIDVREKEEWDYYHLEQSTWIPMQTIPVRLDELDPEEELYIICAHGIRSDRVCAYMSEKGYSRLRNVEGGMAAVAELLGFQYD
ncbi:rhodanese-like domain-containing protein [Paenibacillus methanolicus]|uniref:Rhodanese-like domain-containing protein n=1 Tax=Paenibacillus methanolicus TaxID=582686 RepID=A0A5S5CHI0_9BACL|nr:rhodanese-like domain-containing protein [Paenibacillus methanolicus]TYP77800.1 rhodanese-like domain-containing protein [Paenibacillus methanolicus]